MPQQSLTVLLFILSIVTKKAHSENTNCKMVFLIKEDCYFSFKSQKTFVKKSKKKQKNVNA